MGRLPYFKFYVQDWTIGTLSMTLTEQGAYMRLLAWSWENGPVPLPEAARARLLGLTVDELQELWPALEPFWREGARGYTNKRLEAERRGAQKRSREAREAAAKRWGGKRS